MDIQAPRTPDWYSRIPWYVGVPAVGVGAFLLNIPSDFPPAIQHISRIVGTLSLFALIIGCWVSLTRETRPKTALRKLVHLGGFVAIGLTVWGIIYVYEYSGTEKNVADQKPQKIREVAPHEPSPAAIPPVTQNPSAISSTALTSAPTPAQAPTTTLTNKPKNKHLATAKAPALAAPTPQTTAPPVLPQNWNGPIYVKDATYCPIGYAMIAHLNIIAYPGERSDITLASVPCDAKICIVDVTATNANIMRMRDCTPPLVAAPPQQASPSSAPTQQQPTSSIEAPNNKGIITQGQSGGSNTQTIPPK